MIISSFEGKHEFARTRSDGHGIVVGDTVGTVDFCEGLADRLVGSYASGVVAGCVGDCFDSLVETKEVPDQEISSSVSCD